MPVIKCRSLQASTYTVERIDLSKDKSGKTGGGSEEGRAGDGASSTGDLGRSVGGGGGRDSVVTTAGGGSDGGRRDSSGLSSDARARDLDGGVLDRGVDSGVALGDSNHRVGRNALLTSLSGNRLVGDGGARTRARPGAVASSGGGDRDVGDRAGRLLSRVVTSGLDGRRVGSGLGRLLSRVVARGLDGSLGGGLLDGDLRGGLLNGNLRSFGDGAEGSGNRNALSRDNGAVSRAVGDVGSARDDGVNLGRVDGAGGQREHGRGDVSLAGGAVGDLGTARGDGDKLGGVGGGNIRDHGGHGARGHKSSGRETHLDGIENVVLRIEVGFNEWLSRVAQGGKIC